VPLRLPSLVLLLATLAAPAPAFAVAGGATIDIATVPFTASTTACTATLIAPDRLLTAAHCVESTDPDRSYVIVGADAHDVASARASNAGGHWTLFSPSVAG